MRASKYDVCSARARSAVFRVKRKLNIFRSLLLLPLLPTRSYSFQFYLSLSVYVLLAAFVCWRRRKSRLEASHFACVRACVRATGQAHTQAMIFATHSITTNAAYSEVRAFKGCEWSRIISSAHCCSERLAPTRHTLALSDAKLATEGAAAAWGKKCALKQTRCVALRERTS